MTCSEINFVTSQHFYGLTIALKDELPPISDTNDAWLKALSRINELAIMSAKLQIDANKETQEAAHG